MMERRGPAPRSVAAGSGAPRSSDDGVTRLRSSGRVRGSAGSAPAPRTQRTEPSVVRPASSQPQEVKRDRKVATAKVPGSTPPSTPRGQHVGGVAGTSGKAANVGKMWGDRASKESTSQYSSRISFNIHQYRQLGKELSAAKAQLKDARDKKNNMAKNKRGPVSKVIDELKVLVEELESEREAILEGSHIFKEKLENEERFEVMRQKQQKTLNLRRRRGAVEVRATEVRVMVPSPAVESRLGSRWLRRPRTAWRRKRRSRVADCCGRSGRWSPRKQAFPR